MQDDQGEALDAEMARAIEESLRMGSQEDDELKRVIAQSLSESSHLSHLDAAADEATHLSPLQSIPAVAAHSPRHPNCWATVLDIESLSILEATRIHPFLLHESHDLETKSSSPAPIATPIPHRGDELLVFHWNDATITWILSSST